MQCSAGKCLRLRKMLARQLSDSLTNRKKAARHPQNCLASTDQRVHLQNAAEHVGTPHDIKCIIYSGRPIFNHFSHFPTLPQQPRPVLLTEVGCLQIFKKRKKHYILLFWDDRTVVVRHFLVRINQQLIDPGCQHKKASLVCIAADLWLNFAAKVDISRFQQDILRNWSATVLLPYSFTISCGGLVASLRNRVIFFFKIVFIRQPYCSRCKYKLLVYIVVENRRWLGLGH